MNNQYSSAKGKRGEFLVFGELLKRAAEAYEEISIYLPAIDIGIDAIVRKRDGTYVEIQVKSTQAEDQAGWFNVYDIDQHKGPALYIVCVNLREKPPEFWILPSEVFIEYSNKPYTTKQGWKRYTLGIDSKCKKHGNKVRREILRDYLNAWHLLTG